MAQPSTTYKFELNLTDLDRSVYESVKQTIARHPSETEERMTVRLLAYALWYNEQLSFGRGLSDVDEPALWEKAWMTASALDRSRPAGCRAPDLVLAPRRTHQPAGLRQPARVEGKVVPAAKPEKRQHRRRAAGSAETLAKDMPRVIKWDVMISEGTIFVTDDRGQHEVQLQWLAASAAELALIAAISPTRIPHPHAYRSPSVTRCLPFLGDLPPLLTRLYAARGVRGELDKSLARLIPFSSSRASRRRTCW
jgi:uncharacterized protein YaeQ